MVSMTLPGRQMSPVPTIAKSYARIPEMHAIPNLIRVQLDSFDWFKREGLRELFDEINPITDFSGTRMELRFLDYEFRASKYNEAECRARDITYAAPLFVNTQLLIKDGPAAGERIEQPIFMGDFPLMTTNGTFIINGAERVVVSQLVRSPGVYFTLEEDPASGRKLAYAKLIPNRGAWLEFETSNRDVLSVKVDRRRKIPVTMLLRAIGMGSDEEILAAFSEIDTGDHHFLQSTIDREPTTSQD
ncbi:MAG: DNA-directed RNA polymerase subunit beta, partial [Dehalococcoidia bacterium]|nr:DNA-directed RNA polymerase subunit beta [Dehalococcoidia bacterium]